MNQVGVGAHNVVGTLLAAFDIGGTFVFAVAAQQLQSSTGSMFLESWSYASLLATRAE